MASQSNTSHGLCGFGCNHCTGEPDCSCGYCHPTADELAAAHGPCASDCDHCTDDANCVCIECHPVGKIEIEAFVTGNDRTWRLDVSRALDGNSRSSMVPLYELIAQHFDALCSWPEPIEHSRNELYREQGQAQTRS